MRGRPTVGLVLVGDELLSGAVADTNGPYLIGRLRALGARLKRVVLVGDDADEIAVVVGDVAATCDLVCTTGGIGPTHDDVTIDGVAQALGVPVVEDPGVVAWMRARLGREPEPEHRRMARVPQGTQIVAPAPGPRPGSPPALVAANVALLPGVPSLMRACFALVEDRFRGAPRWRQALEVTADETALAGRLREVAVAHPQVVVGSYPRLRHGDEGSPEDTTTGDERPRWTVRLTVEGDRRADVHAASLAIQDALAGLHPTIEPPEQVGPSPRGQDTSGPREARSPLNSPGRGGR